MDWGEYKRISLKSWKFTSRMGCVCLLQMSSLLSHWECDFPFYIQSTQSHKTSTVGHSRNGFSLLILWFVFQAQAIKACASNDKNCLQFEEGEIILVLSDSQAEVRCGDVLGIITEMLTYLANENAQCCCDPGCSKYQMWSICCLQTSYTNPTLVQFGS